MTSAVSSILFTPEFLAERRPVGDVLFQIDKLLADLEKGRPADPAFLRDLSMRIVGEVEQGGDLPIHWQRWLVRYVHGRFQVQGVAPRRLEWLARLLQRLIMVVEVGFLMKLGPVRIQDMAVAAVLHDCGSVHLLGKGHLDRAQVRAALEQGWTEDLSPFRDESWMSIVMSSKEQVDGSGYPHGLKGDEIPVESRIINLIASFQAIVQPRDYRINLLPSQALELLLRKDRHRYDSRVAASLLKAMTPFPAGCLVAVRDVGVGEVVRPHYKTPMRPEVAVILDERMRPIPNPRRVDIRAMPILNVHKAFCMGELQEDVWKLFDPPAPLSVRSTVSPPPAHAEGEKGAEPPAQWVPPGPRSILSQAHTEAIQASPPVPPPAPEPAPTIPDVPPAQRSLSFAEQMAKQEAERQGHGSSGTAYPAPPVSSIVQPPTLFANHGSETAESEAHHSGDDLFAERGGQSSEPGLDPADHPFFRLLPEEILAQVPFERLPVMQMKEGEMLLHRGEAADSMLLLLSGQVELIAPDGFGQPAVITHRSGGEVVGELGLLDGTRLVDARAVHDGWYIPLSKKLVVRLMEEAPQVGSTLRALHRLHGSM